MAGESSRVLRMMESIGRPVSDVLQTMGEQWALFMRTLRFSFGGQHQKGAVAGQMYEIGNKSLLFITATMGVLGMISIFQVTLQIEKVLPDFSRVGAGFLQVLVREFGPTVCGLMVATRTGSAIAAEIGSMVVTEQVDALRMSNTDPIRYLVVPRFLACGPMLPVLAVYGILIAYFTGMLTGNLWFNISFSTFMSMELVRWQDVYVGVTKMFAYGFAIPIIAAHAGLSARGGSEGVGTATTRSVVNCSFAVILLDFVISGTGYVVFG